MTAYKQLFECSSSNVLQNRINIPDVFAIAKATDTNW